MRQVVIHEDAESGGWVAEVPSLPGCVSDGDTRDQAMTNIRDAIEAWIEVAQQLGREIPPNIEIHVASIE